MSTQPKRGIAAEGVSAEAVAHYLRSHPEFFERQGQLLAQLRLPHEVAGATVSLVERQVDILRQSNRKLERKLRDFVDVARFNDTLAVKIHNLALGLIRAPDLDAALDSVEAILRGEFGADMSILVLFDTNAVEPVDEHGRFLRRIRRDHESLKAFETLLSSGSPRCGQIRDSQRDFLFGKDTNEVGSAAMIPLGRGAELGILAIGSNDAERFHPAMSTDYLGRIGDLVAGAVRP